MQLIQKINGDLENWKATKLNIFCLTKNQRIHKYGKVTF